MLKINVEPGSHLTTHKSETSCSAAFLLYGVALQAFDPLCCASEHIWFDWPLAELHIGEETKTKTRQIDGVWFPSAELVFVSSGRATLSDVGQRGEVKKNQRLSSMARTVKRVYYYYTHFFGNVAQVELICSNHFAAVCRRTARSCFVFSVQYTSVTL